MDRLVIEISGNLPDARKFKILASAEDAAREFADGLVKQHDGLVLSVSVRAARPMKKAAAVGVPLAALPPPDPPQPVVPSDLSGTAQPPPASRHGGRTAAE